MCIEIDADIDRLNCGDAARAVIGLAVGSDHASRSIGISGKGARGG